MPKHTKHSKLVGRCKICTSPDSDKLNRDMVLHSMTAPELETKYGFPARLINKHRDHIGQRLALAQERKEKDAADQLLADIDKLWAESCDFLEVSKEAVKTQAVTEMVEETTYVNGKKVKKMVPKTVYKEYRDLGATATAIRVSQENRRLFGDVTGAIHPPQDRYGPGVVLHVIIPGFPKPSERPREIKEQDAIDTTAETVE